MPETATSEIEILPQNPVPPLDTDLKRGPPPEVLTAAYLDGFIKRVTLREWDVVVQIALRQAQEGNDKARRWITEMIDRLPGKSRRELQVAPFQATSLIERVMTLAPQPPTKP